MFSFFNYPNGSVISRVGFFGVMQIIVLDVHIIDVLSENSLGLIVEEDMFSCKGNDGQFIIDGMHGGSSFNGREKLLNIEHYLMLGL